MIGVRPICLDCKHFFFEVEDKFSCAAFPAGIPEDIYMGRVIHTKPYPGDRDIVFEQREEQ